MPNWCQNRVTLRGAAEKLKEIAAAIKDEEREFSFARILPMPDALKGIQHGGTVLPDGTYANTWKGVGDGARALGEGEAADLLAKYGAVDWYSWRNRHWNTKWDAGNPVLTEEPGKLIYDFDTAWSPPLPVVFALAQRFPEVSVTHAYIETGMMFGGLDTFTDGQLDETFESEDVDELRVLSEWHTDVLSYFDEPEEQEKQETAPTAAPVLSPEQVTALNTALGKLGDYLADLTEEPTDTSES